MTNKIITTHVWPPIPRRDWDWCAYHDGEEETNHYGWGATEQEALDDLKRMDEERAEANEDHPVEVDY
jgi:hypothetical protein